MFPFPLWQSHLSRCDSDSKILQQEFVRVYLSEVRRIPRGLAFKLPFLRTMSIVVFNYQLNYYFLFLNMLFPMGVIGLGNRHIKVYSLEGEPREIRLMSNINWSNFRLKF